MWVSQWLHQREGKEEVFSFCKKAGFEFPPSPEHAFTSGAIYCLKAEIFWASPHFIEAQVGLFSLAFLSSFLETPCKKHKCKGITKGKNVKNKEKGSRRPIKQYYCWRNKERQRFWFFFNGVKIKFFTMNIYFIFPKCHFDATFLFNANFFFKIPMPFSKCHIYQIWHWKMPSGIADIQIGWSEKNIFVRVDVSAIYRAKISLDLSISASPHWLDLVLLGGEILHANLLRRSVYGPIYLLGQKLGFDPKIGFCPNFWDLSQFLGFDPIFGENPNFWDLQPLGQGIGKEVAPKTL